MNQQDEHAFSTGEIAQPISGNGSSRARILTREFERDHPCEHRYVRFNPSTGITRCNNPECDIEIDISELAEPLPAEGPYDLILDLGELGGCRP